MGRKENLEWVENFVKKGQDLGQTAPPWKVVFWTMQYLDVTKPTAKSYLRALTSQRRLTVRNGHVCTNQ